MYIYFSYGIEMISHFMRSICPSAIFNGVGVCHHYRFQINEKGLADMQPSNYSSIYGFVWKLNQSDHNHLLKWADGYFPKLVKEPCFPEILVSAQNENVSFSKNPQHTSCKAFFFRSLSTQYGQASLQYINTLINQLQNVGVSQDYISELRLWISIQ
ncbi:MAG: hypothetical protein PHX86_01035 [Caldisericia bacterium]|nr:hypothetical protein [Caldisericia bacterium]